MSTKDKRNEGCSKGIFNVPQSKKAMRNLSRKNIKEFSKNSVSSMSTCECFEDLVTAIIPFGIFHIPNMRTYAYSGDQ